MKKLILSILFLPLFASANPPIIWGPSGSAQMLTPSISFTPNNTFIISGTLDPSAVATSAAKGSLYSSTNGNLYVKQDAGLTTNWSAVSTTGGGTSLGAIDGQAAAANGASIAAGVLYMQSEDATHPGLVNNAAQTISGAKTFSSTIVGSVNGNAATVTTNANLTGPITSVGNTTSVASQTGTGSVFVMQGTPTLTTPVIGAATGTSLSVSGQLTSTVSTGTAPLVVSSTTQVANLNAATAGSATTATTATNATNTAVTDDTTANATMYPTWVTTTTGNLPQKLSSTKLTFNPSTSTLTATTFAGNASTATTATNATNGTTVAVSNSASYFPLFVSSSSNGNQAFDLGTGLTFNPSTNNLSTTTFTGALAGNSTTATTATNATNMATVSVSNSASYFPIFAASSTNSNQAHNLGTGLTFNPSTNNLATTTFTGALTGTASGNTTYTANNHGVVVSGSANTMTVVAPNASTAFPLVSGGASADPAWSLLTVAGGGTNSATVVSTPAATAWAGWDANSNLSANNHIEGYRTTATAAGTTTLVVGDAFSQFFTGTTTQTVKMPVTSTLVLGQQYLIVNNSTGNVTVQSSGANSVQVMTQNTQLLMTCILTSGTGVASWSGQYTANLSAVINPTYQTFTSGSAATYTTPAGVQFIKVRLVGGGGGGSGSGSAGSVIGGTGGTTSFGTSLLSAVGGSPGNGAAPGAGGTVSIGTAIGTKFQGGTGSPGQNAGAIGEITIGGDGAGTTFSGGGTGGAGGGTGGAPVANSGAGGGGGGGAAGVNIVAGGGGGAGGYIDVIIFPSAGQTFTYTVGAAGSAGGAGTSGVAGTAGAAGYIEVLEFYTNYAVGTTTSVSANNVLVGPTSGAAANPTFRALVANDAPTAMALNVSYNSASASISANAVFKYDTTVFDTNSGWSVSTGLYTVPAGLGGKYLVSFRGLGGATFNAYLKVNGTATDVLCTVTNGVAGSGSAIVSLSAADTIGVYTDTTVTLTAKSGSVGYYNSFALTRLGP